MVFLVHGGPPHDVFGGRHVHTRRRAAQARERRVDQSGVGGEQITQPRPGVVPRNLRQQPEPRGGQRTEQRGRAAVLPQRGCRRPDGLQQRLPALLVSREPGLPPRAASRIDRTGEHVLELPPQPVMAAGSFPQAVDRQTRGAGPRSHGAQRAAEQPVGGMRVRGVERFV